jgi:hypothetical protein
MGLLVCLPVTLVMYTGTGLHVNQLIDVSALGVLAVASALLDEQVRRSLSRAVLAVATVASLTEAVMLDGMSLKRGELAEVIAALPRGADPVLSEAPWIPLLAGERVFLLDAFSLLQTRKSHPPVDRDLLQRLDNCRFRAVVLIGRVKDNPWYDEAQFGPGFKEHLQRSYGLASLVGGHAIYLPRCPGSAAAATIPAVEPTGETQMERGNHPNKARQLLRRLLGR